MASLPAIPRFRDVGASINDISGHQYLKPGLLYNCGNLGRIDESPADDVDRASKDQMRLHYKVRTVVDTTGFRKRFLTLPEDAMKYVPEGQHEITREELLGLQYCTIQLRSSKYRQDAWARVPFWAKCKMGTTLIFNSQGFTSAAKSYVLEYVQTGAIIDTMRILDAEPKEIGELFNHVLTDARAYPLVLAGGRLLAGSSILILLILLLLEVPFEHVDKDLTMAYKQFAVGPTPKAITEEVYEDFRATYDGWAKAIRGHIEINHGGIVAYLLKTGASTASLQAIKHHLSADKKEEKLIDVSVEEYSEKDPKD